MVVAKFGGSSLAGVKEYKRVAEIVRKNRIPVVVVSAPGGKVKITDLLIAAVSKWRRSGKVDGEIFDAISDRFIGIARPLGVRVDTYLAEIKAAINAGCGYDYAVSRGEYLSARILAEVMGYSFVDARECIKLTSSGAIDMRSIRAHIGAVKAPCVIPGFYGKLPGGAIKLLPRGGSDLSGAAIASALNAPYQKWTDVDGIFDGHGGVMQHIGYDEAELLCYFGATVVHYEAMNLLKNADVSLTVKNTFSDSCGTVISKKRHDGWAFCSKNMYLGGNEAANHEAEILGGGLKIPLRIDALGNKKILVDGCGFSPLALKRILCYDGIDEVTVTAAIGNIPFDFMPQSKLVALDCGSIYYTKVSMQAGMT